MRKALVSLFLAGILLFVPSVPAYATEIDPSGIPVVLGDIDAPVYVRVGSAAGETLLQIQSDPEVQNDFLGELVICDDYIECKIEALIKALIEKASEESGITADTPTRYMASGSFSNIYASMFAGIVGSSDLPTVLAGAKSPADLQREDAGAAVLITSGDWDSAKTSAADPDNGADSGPTDVSPDGFSDTNPADGGGTTTDP